MVLNFGITRSSKVLASTSIKLEGFLEEEPNDDGRFRKVVGGLVWLTNQTRPNILTPQGP